MVTKYYDKTAYLVRPKSKITCSLAALEFAVLKVNMVRRSSFATAPIELKREDGGEGHIQFYDDSSKTFGNDLHAVVNELLNEADLADGEPEFHPFLLGIGDLQMIADFALEGAFEAVW